MIQHIVAFRLSGTDNEEKRRQSSLAQAELRKLGSGQIPGLIDLRVRPDLGKVATHWDLVLVSHHESETALENYMAHPLHVDVAQKVAAHVAEKVIIDSQI
jgi:Stress responsive A/B Barrel Domain